MGTDVHQPNCAEDVLCPPIPGIGRQYWVDMIAGPWVARRYRLPWRSSERYDHGVEAHNAQAAYESSMIMQSVLLSGASEAVDEALRECIAKREVELPEGVE